MLLHRHAKNCVVVMFPLLNSILTGGWLAVLNPVCSLGSSMCTKATQKMC